MATLAELSLSRIRGGLDAIITGFAPLGSSVQERLVAGRITATLVLMKYVPDFKFDVSEAEAQMREIDVWAERNQAALEQVMGSTATDLPAALRLSMGSTRARQFVISSFTQAASGLGPWNSGKVAEMAESGEVINDRWAREDAEQRLQVFAIIVKMDEDGHLASIFLPPGATGSFGAVVPVWLIIVAIVALAAALVTTVVLWRRITLNNKLLSDICKRAQERGDMVQVQYCIDAATGLQETGFERAAVILAKRLSLALVVAAGVYAGFKYGLPWAAKRLDGKKPGKLRLT